MQKTRTPSHRSRSTRRVSLFAAAILVSSWQLGTAQERGAEPLPADRAQGAASIEAATLETWLTQLASEEFAGRGTGQDGFVRAAELFEKHFRELGLEPLRDESYRIEVPWIRIEPVAAKTWIEVRRGKGDTVRLSVDDGLCATASSDVTLSGSLVLLRIDGASDDLPKVEFQDGDAVLAIALEPLSSRRDYDRISSHVRQAGGRLYAVANDALAKSLPTNGASIPAGGNRAAASRGRLPRRFVLDNAQRDLLLEAAGQSIDLVEEAAEPLTRLDALALACQTRVENVPAPAWNVGAILRGSDPKLREEFVVIGSHLDHLGRRGNTIYPGADDDGSGSTSVLALANAFVKNGKPPRRSILFVAFCGEEMGLVGSAHFAQNCPIPLENIVTELQLDMVGRSEESTRTGETADDNRNVLHLVGTEKLSADLHELCLRLNEERSGFDLEWDEERVFYRSDHWNFAKHGVPVAFFFTGFHNDYHKPSDTADKIEFDKLARVVRYVYDIAFELAQQDARPSVERARWNKLEKKARKEPAAPVRGRDGD